MQSNPSSRSKTNDANPTIQLLVCISNRSDLRDVKQLPCAPEISLCIQETSFKAQPQAPACFVWPRRNSFVASHAGRAKTIASRIGSSAQKCKLVGRVHTDRSVPHWKVPQCVARACPCSSALAACTCRNQVMLVSPEVGARKTASLATSRSWFQS